MKTLKITAVSILMVFMTSCKVVVNTSPDQTAGNSKQSLHNISLNGKVFSAVWQQNAGEFRALCYQAFNLAQLRIDENLKKPSKRPLAIITDIDETFLDNSPYAVTEAEQGKDYDAKTWMNWTSKGEAKAYPGSLNFFNYAASKKITIFYISNRAESDRIGTLKNLKDLGFPNADDAHLLLRGTTSDKEARRLEVLKNYDVIIYMGDNLADFSKIFNKKPQTERNELVDQNSNEFGKRFIMLPNSGYGDWESALKGYNNQLTPAEKDKVMLENLRGY
ncbi:5'-nucleotidase, lipoprotein e(P4) family [Kaistella flava (ex Peng et al. 2021)]|uniref:5'-nucleotidase, lipoprotein e(P4) family n=1 Tax=Kaistella flava (ex Peng et al. 2021) TaxID=2038776 RepID=A0A7M2YAS1_9FLAO|nr:5'-nucleotidase, lipoprotein e(P4) family [Kaistella flava (ex Peng et al. 2021)]QOW10735.1 5'-nucleotidase, lipoprotein e(P4) family [Kaistella flava (ex Peng et al. 2021)]